MDDLTKPINVYNTELKPIFIDLQRDKDIRFVKICEVNEELNKQYIRAAFVMVGDVFLASTFSDTVHMMEEFYLFDGGNDQNKYLAVLEHQKTKNLKLKYDGENDIFISKSEAKAIYKLFNFSIMGYSVARVMEYEYKFTPQILTQLLHNHGFFDGDKK